MVLLKRFVPAALALSLLTGCQMGYYLKSAYNHLSMMSRREPIREVLKRTDLTADTRRKLELAVEAHEFAIAKLGLKETSNYTTYVDLGRPYVSWVVSAAPRWKLEHHKWNYLFVGSLPYKGFASEEEAMAEKKTLDARDLDTWVRGVSAYSTVGWLHDSVLSSMLRSSASDLVNTIIHETVHATLYIKSNADFNERLAVFVGNKGTEQFYLSVEGPESPTLKHIADENADEKLFSEFIGAQLSRLKEWYSSLPEAERNEDARRARFEEIKQAFVRDVQPKMKTKAYARFPYSELNNARLMLYKTYVQDLADFEKLFDLTGGDWKLFFDCAKSLEDSDDPELALKDLNRRLSEAPEAAKTACSNR